MTAYSFGDVVVAKIKFSDMNEEKPRPAVVVSRDAYHSRKPDIIVASITSNLNFDGELGEFIIHDLPSVGLTIPSRVKAFVSTIDPEIVKYKIGKLSQNDLRSLHTMLQKLFH
jgi:mRNA-degrading endonuclease toxin of MazEF toxin-antitoxin module